MLSVWSRNKEAKAGLKNSSSPNLIVSCYCYNMLYDVLQEHTISGSVFVKLLLTLRFGELQKKTARATKPGQPLLFI